MITTLLPPRPITVPGQRRERDSPCLPGPVHGPQTADDIMIGVALTTRWMLITGRRLHQGPLLHDLPAEQLIGFWADDHQPAPRCR